jgi:hypothetical protein
VDIVTLEKQLIIQSQAAVTEPAVTMVPAIPQEVQPNRNKIT